MKHRSVSAAPDAKLTELEDGASAPRAARSTPDGASALRAARSTPEDVRGPDALRNYVLTMPSPYREAFDDAAIEAHAAIVLTRGAAACRVEIWRELTDENVALCVVADDSPGLLSRISAALVAHDIDVVAAQAYVRRRADAQLEAVDFFWVRRAPSARRAPRPIGAREVAHIGESLDALVRGRASVDGAVHFVRAVRSASASTRVRFEGETKDGYVILTVEAVDRPGLLLQISRALFRERVQIAHSSVSTRQGHALDRFHLAEWGGGPIRRARLLALQTAVLAAIEESHRAEE